MKNLQTAIRKQEEYKCQEDQISVKSTFNLVMPKCYHHVNTIQNELVCLYFVYIPQIQTQISDNLFENIKNPTQKIKMIH